MGPIRAAGRWIALLIGVGVVALIAVLAVVTSRHQSGPGAITYGRPAIAAGAAMAFDPAAKGVILFGGEDATGRALADTWLWDGRGWTRLHPSQSPPARHDAALGWDPMGNQLILTGGKAGISATMSPDVCIAGGQRCAIGGTQALTDTWAFDGSTWKQLHPLHQALTAPGGGGVYLATDTQSNALMLVHPLGATLRGPMIACVQGKVCRNFVESSNAVFLWTNGDWVARGSLAGELQSLATDPSTGNVAAALGPSNSSCVCCGIETPTTARSPQASAAAADGAATKGYLCPADSAIAPAAPRSPILEWHSGRWIEIDAKGSPPGSYPNMSGDTYRQQLLVLPSGGDSWVWSNQGWERKSDFTPLQISPGRQGIKTPDWSYPGLLADDPQAEGVILLRYPPAADDSVIADDTYRWTGKTWVAVDSPATPVPTAVATSTPDPIECLANASAAPTNNSEAAAGYRPQGEPATCPPQLTPRAIPGDDGPPGAIN